MPDQWYQLSIADVQKKLGTVVSGLAVDEVRARRRQYGANLIPSKGGANPVVVFLRQFSSPLMVLLILAGIGSLLVGEERDAIVIGLAVLVNSVVGFIQEWKAEQAAQVLTSYEIPHAQVRRGGEIMSVPAPELVPGDIVLLAAGSRIPADIRLTDVVDADVDESLLTGEAYPVKKATRALSGKRGVGDRANMAFMGTLLAGGRAEGIVVATGTRTQLGSIAKLVSETVDDKTPLQTQLTRFSWVLGVLVVVVAVALSTVGYLTGSDPQEMVGIAIALIVAAIPEGLLVAFTVVLAVGMQRMFKRKTLVRRLVAAETLGSVSVVCTDKTGTITEGNMVVVQVRTPDTLATRFDTVSDDVREVLLAAALNNDVELNPEGKPTGGHPTERALVTAALTAGLNVAQARDTHRRTAEIPFSGDRKYMVTQHKGLQGERVIMKGAPERVLALCRMTEGEREAWQKRSEEMTSQGLRVLAVASKQQSGELVEPVTELTCHGLIGISDPLRPSTRGTIAELRQAGLRVVLITGDHPSTAEVIARDAGIELGEHATVTGAELDDISDEELRHRIARIRIFARVDPRHKVRIVQAWRSHGEVVAMVGDGVNDAAAMKAADIGVALGSGTDVAHETSDMVLLNDDLSTVTDSVREGRVVFDNMRKIIVYLVSDTFSQVVLIAGALVIGLPLPLLAVQILWINLVTDGLPNMALTMEHGEDDVMKRKPRPRNEPILNGEMKLLIFFIGLITDVGLLVAYLWLERTGIDIAHLRTILFSSLAVGSLIYVFAVRSLRQSIFRMNPFENRWLLAAVGLGLVLQILVVTVPVFQGLFQTVALSATDWLLVLGLGSLKLIALELGKESYLFWQRRHATST